MSRPESARLRTAVGAHLGAGVERGEITASEIVAAADQLIAESGVEGLTIKNLSARLGVSMGAMYHHVDGKQALIGMVAEGIYRRIECPSPEEGDWVARCDGLMVRFHNEMRRYPGLAAYVMANFAPDVSFDQVTADLQRVLVSDGFTLAQARRAYTTLFYFGLGALLSDPLISAQVGDAKCFRMFHEGLRQVLLGIKADLNLPAVRS